MIIEAGAKGRRASVLPRQDRKILLKELIPIHVERNLGIPVELHGGAYKVKYADGLETIQIDDLESLVATASMVRALVPIKLASIELKALRKAIEYTGKALAEALETTAETISRWENGQQPMGGYVEKNFRLLVCSILKEKAPAVNFDCSMIAFMKIKVVTDAEFKFPPIPIQRVHLQRQASEQLIEAWWPQAKAA